MITRLAHCAFVVGDMAKSLDFYCGKLGLTHAFSIPDAQGNPWIEYLKIADFQFLELFYPNNGLPEAGGRCLHLCLEVADCEAAEAELRAKGAPVTSGTKSGRDGNRQCWTADPDGNAIELMEISPLSPQYRASQEIQ